MPSLISGYIRSTFQVLYSDGYSGRVSLFRTPALTFADGSGAGQANRVYTNSATMTIAASGTLSIDLSGSVTDAFGNTLTLTKLRALLIEHLTTTTSTNITVGGGANPIFGSKLSGLEINNGDHMLFTCKNGYTITGGSADTLRIVNADGTNQATVRISVLGSQ